MSEGFTHLLRVRYAECDMQGHVFNAHYFTWVDIAHLELIRHAVGPHSELLAEGFDYVVAEEGARFRGAAHFDDDVTIAITVDPIGASSMTSRYRMSRGENLLVEAWVRHVCVDAKTMAKASWPERVRSGLAPYIAEPPAKH